MEWGKGGGTITFELLAEGKGEVASRALEAEFVIHCNEMSALDDEIPSAPNEQERGAWNEAQPLLTARSLGGINQ